jgi:hypothetical protein
MNDLKRKQIARAAAKRRAQIAAGEPVTKDVDFEKMFGKDIEAFLDDSEWELESMGDKMSNFSKGHSVKSASNRSKLRGLERAHLTRVESQGRNLTALQATGEKVAMSGGIRNSTTALTQGKMSTSGVGLPKPNSRAKFREVGQEDGDDQASSLGRGRASQQKPKKAWDAASRQSSQRHQKSSSINKTS